MSAEIGTVIYRPFVPFPKVTNVWGPKDARRTNFQRSFSGTEHRGFRIEVSGFVPKALLGGRGLAFGVSSDDLLVAFPQSGDLRE